MAKAVKKNNPNIQKKQYKVDYSENGTLAFDSISEHFYTNSEFQQDLIECSKVRFDTESVNFLLAANATLALAKKPDFDPNEYMESLCNLYDEYIKAGSPQQVNLAMTAVTPIANLVKSYRENKEGFNELFDHAHGLEVVTKPVREAQGIVEKLVDTNLVADLIKNNDFYREKRIASDVTAQLIQTLSAYSTKNAHKVQAYEAKGSFLKLSTVDETRKHDNLNTFLTTLKGYATRLESATTAAGVKQIHSELVAKIQEHQLADKAAHGKLDLLTGHTVRGIMTDALSALKGTPDKQPAAKEKTKLKGPE